MFDEEVKFSLSKFSQVPFLKPAIPAAAELQSDFINSPIKSALVEESTVVTVLSDRWVRANLRGLDIHAGVFLFSCSFN